MYYKHASNITNKYMNDYYNNQVSICINFFRTRHLVNTEKLHKQNSNAYI